MSYPILYDSAETKFDSNGIGVLSDAISCIVTEERNGQFELQMDYPVDGIHYADIQDRCLIMAKPNPVDDAQPFRVYSSTSPINGIVTFYARHISYDLLGIPVSPFTSGSIQDAMLKLKSNAVKDCPFTFYTDKDTVATMTVKTPSPIRNLLGGQAGSVLDTYGGGEYKFDRFDIWLRQHRGTDRGVNIRYGKNLVDFKQEKNCANVYTGVYPYWTNTEGVLVELPEKVINGPGEYDYDHIKVYDFSQEWQEEPSVEQLRSRTESYIKANNIGVPSVSLTVTHVMLEQTEEYKGSALLERIDLCDTARIEFPKLGVSASAEAVKTEFNVLLNRYESITFGDANTDLIDTVVSQKAEIKQSEESTKSVVGQAIDKFNRDMANASGMYTTEEEQLDGSTITYLHDKKTIAESKNVIKITSDAVGVSTDGGKTYPFGLYVNGDLVSRILTAIGINADWINAGILQSLPDENGQRAFFLDLLNGVLRMNATELTIAGKNVNEALSESITGTEQQYYMSDSPTNLSGGSWSSKQPTWTPGKYIFNRQYVTYGNGGYAYLPSETGVCITGNTGAAGAPGSPGTNGTSSYTHIRYSANSDGSGFVTEPNENTKYIGIYTGPSQTAPESNTAYVWSKYIGDNGTNGKDGNGIRSITYYYAATQDQTVPDASKVTETALPTLSETNKYLWQKEVIDFTDSSVDDKTTVILLAVYGDKGKDGTNGTNGTSVTITSTSIEYKADANGTTAPSGGWNASIPPVSNGQYLWTKTVVTYSDGTTTTAYSVAYKGTNGTNGENGVGIESMEAEYYVSDSATQATGGTWSVDMPTVQPGKYIWTRQKITYTDGNVEHSGQYCLSKTMGDIADERVDKLNELLNMKEIARRLSNNWENQGFFMGEDGNVYINASLVRAGILDLALLTLKGDLGGIMEGEGSTSKGPTRGFVIFGPAGINAESGQANPTYMIMSEAGWRVQLDDIISIYSSGFSTGYSTDGKGLAVNGDIRVFALDDGSHGRLTVDKTLTVGESAQIAKDDESGDYICLGKDANGYLYLARLAPDGLLYLGNSAYPRGVLLYGDSVYINQDNADTYIRGRVDFSQAQSVTGLPNSGELAIEPLFTGSLSSGYRAISGSGYKCYIVVVSPGSSASRVSVVIPEDELGNKHQAADNEYYTSFTLTASRITYGSSNGNGVIRAVYGIS